MGWLVWSKCREGAVRGGGRKREEGRKEESML